MKRYVDGDLVKNKYSLILWVCLLAILLFPILMYSYKFGFGVWQEHDDWASMGTALGGIYSPMIALLAFAVIFAQARIQLLSEKHSRDMVFIHDTKQDFNFYLERLEHVLEQQVDGGLTVNQLLISVTDSFSEDKLSSEECLALFKHFDSKYRKVWGLWCGIIPLLKGLESQKHFPYEHNFLGLKLRAVSVLSQHTCCSLDKLDYVLSKGKSTGSYYWVS